jgi:hypothetical protein
MASTLNSTQADPRSDGGGPPTMATDLFTDVEEALARHVHESFTPQTGAQGVDRARERRLLRKRRRRLTRAAIALCLGASAIWAWRSYGGSAPDQAAALPAVEASAPPPAQVATQAASTAQPETTAANEPGAASAKRQPIETTDLAALRQTVEQLAAGQEQLTREIAKLQAEKPQANKPPAEKQDKRTPRGASAHPTPPVAAPARKPAPTTPLPPHAAPQVSTVSRLAPPPRPAPQIQSETQPSVAPSLRPPMPVPQN